MNILVLDTIHGGKEIARHLSSLGHTVDCVDVYRGREGISTDEALSRQYDLVAAPVHLTPDHPLMQIAGTAYTTHHEIVGTILRPLHLARCIEITGTRGKTTTAHALAHGMHGPGVLHTSTGTYRFPGKTLLWKKSITPASLIDAAEQAASIGGWLIAEESIGVSGAGDLGILTSDIDYLIAGGTKSALGEKRRMLAGCREVLCAPGTGDVIPGAIATEDIVSLRGTRCSYAYEGRRGSFDHPLFEITGYRIPLMTAAAALCILGEDPALLSTFSALEARMKVTEEGERVVVDNANSGACLATTCDAAALARRLLPAGPLTLVVGAESSTVCEGFPFADIAEVIKNTSPATVIIVGDQYRSCSTDDLPAAPLSIVSSLEEGAALARSVTGKGAIVLAVKTWR